MKKMLSIFLAIFLLAFSVYAADTTILQSADGNAISASNPLQVTVAASSINTSSINWPSVKNMELNSAGINWYNVNGLKPINTGGMNWTSIKNMELQSAGINWTDVKSLQIQMAGINWTSLDGNIQNTGINWTSAAIANGSFLKSTGTNITGDSNAYAVAGAPGASTYRSVTVNATGGVTAGSNPTTFSGYGISDTSANLAAALTDEVGTGFLVFNASPNFTGNIGIGSTNPGQVLDVAGNIRSRGTNAHYFGDDNKADIEASATTTPDMVFKTNSTERMRITNGGNLGIGTSVPRGILEINSASGAASFLTVDSAGNIGIGTTLANGGLSIMNGNVGIGTWKPSNNLVVTVGAIGGNSVVQLGNSSTSQNSTMTFSTTGDNSLSIATNYSGGTKNAIILSPAGSERMRIVQGGNIGIGTTVPANTLSVVGNAAIGATGNVGIAAPSNGLYVQGNVGIGSLTPGQALDVQGTIRQSNDKSCATGLTSNSNGDITGCVASDARLKNSIVIQPYDPDLISKFKPVQYRWNDPASKDANIHAGFIAQDVEKIFPEAVVAAGDIYKGIDPNAVLSVVVSEVQTHRKFIDSQKIIDIILFIFALMMLIRLLLREKE